MPNMTPKKFPIKYDIGSSSKTQFDAGFEHIGKMA
jgi:hypothetical protein